jgi:hypothetical protein
MRSLFLIGAPTNIEWFAGTLVESEEWTQEMIYYVVMTLEYIVL